MTAIVLLTSAAMLLPSPARGDGSSATGCHPVAIMAIRGSGETFIGEQHYKGQTSPAGAEGATLQRLLHAYAYSDGYDESVLGDVPIIGLANSYPATEVDTLAELTSWFATDSPVWNSAQEGTVAAIRTMGEFQRQQASSCPVTQWVLVGYSQGAMVAHYTYEVMRSRIASLYLVGDPLQLPNGAGNSGLGANGTGIVVTQFPRMKKGSVGYYATRPASSITFCHDNDIICDFGPYYYGAKYHTDYFTTEAEKRSEGRRLALMVTGAVRQNTTPETTKPPAEIVFAIDTTGSMGPYIAAACNRARTLGQQVLDSSPSSRVGLVEYRDHGDDFVSRTVVPLTRDVDAFASGLDGLTPAQGGDTPESAYSGMLEALGSDWSPTATHAVAVIADAPAHDPEPETGYTASYVAARFRGVSASIAHASRARAFASAAPSEDRPSALVFGLSADAELSEQLSGIAAQTGGNVFDIGDDGSVGELMSQVLEETTTNPVASLTSTTSVEGERTVVSALGSSGVGRLTFDFDLDGDGTYERTDADPTLAIALTPGVHEIGVRVTDPAGRFSTASVTVTTARRAEAFQSALDEPADFQGVRVVGGVAVAGHALTITVPPSSAPDGTWLLTALHRVGDRVFDPALAVSNTVVAPAMPRLDVPATVRPGTYRLDVLGADGRYAAVPIRVVAPAAARRSTRIAVSSTRVIRHGRALTLLVRVGTDAGEAQGPVAVTEGRRVLAGGALSRGQVKLRTTHLRRRGVHSLVIRYLGSRTHAPSGVRWGIRVR